MIDILNRIISRKMIPIPVKTFFSIILVLGLFNPGNPGPATGSPLIVRYGDSSFSTIRILETSPMLFSIMNFEPIALNTGRKSRCPEGVVLTMKTKTRMFGDGPALGKTITVDTCRLEVVGIIRDVHEKSYLQCDLVILRDEPEMSVEAFANIRSLIMK